MNVFGMVAPKDKTSAGRTGPWAGNGSNEKSAGVSV